MASTASDLLKIELQADGENDTTWGQKLNTAFGRVEEAIAGLRSISLNSLGGAGYTLDDTQYVENDNGASGESHVAIIKCTGTLDSDEEVIVPSRTKKYLVWNATSGSYSVTFKTSGGTGVAVPQGSVMSVFCDATNVEAASAAVDTGGALVLGALTLGGILTADGNQVRWAKGADVASANALSLGDDGNYFDITGTTSITSIGTKAVGTVVRLHFDGALTLTHHATDLILPGGANITTAAGDEAEFVEYATGDWRCTNYLRNAHRPLYADITDNLTVGFTTDVYAIGNSGTGTQTVSLTEECLQSMTINGSFTLAPPSSGSGVAIIDATNDGTGGYTMTTSGFTKVNGSYDNTASKQHRFIVTKIGSTSILDISEIA